MTQKPIRAPDPRGGGHGDPRCGAAAQVQQVRVKISDNQRGADELPAGAKVSLGDIDSAGVVVVERPHVLSGLLVVKIIARRRLSRQNFRNPQRASHDARDSRPWPRSSVETRIQEPAGLVPAIG
jgi:hypothetical protein